MFRAILLFVNSAALLLSIIGLMAVFIGGKGYLPVVIVFLILSWWVTLGSIIGAWLWFARRFGARNARCEIWQRLPNWLVFGLALTLALIVCGSTALAVTLYVTGIPPAFWQHVPLLSATAAIVAICTVYAIDRERVQRPRR